MIICPSFFDGRLDGIGRVSGAFHRALSRMNGREPFVLSANDLPGTCPVESGRCFGRNYPRMMLSAVALNRQDLAATMSVPASRPPGEGDAPASGTPIVCIHLGLSPVARVVSARLGLPYVVFVHGVEAWRLLRRRSRWGVAGADCLLFNSNFTLANFRRFNSWAAGIPSKVVPLGLAVENAPTSGPVISARPPRDRSRDFRVLIVGRMTKAEYYEGFRNVTDLYKGFKQLILAVGLLTRRVPGARLLIVGEGDARVDLERWLAERPEREAVDFLGRVTDGQLDLLYRESDAFALPSEGEGFGLVFVEAMAHGLPCVCVHAGASPEVVEDGVTGLIARPRDVVDLADKLIVLARNPVIRESLGSAARERFERHFTQRAFEDRIIAALQSI